MKYGNKNMSRIGKKPILILEGTEIKIDGKKVFVKGLKGELSRDFFNEIKIEIKGNQVFVSPRIQVSEASQTDAKHSSRRAKQEIIKNKQVKALWGLSRALLFNMIEGVNKGFEKKLEIQGIGFKAAIEGEEIILNVGFSHPVKIKIPFGLKISVEKNIIIISGIDKELVGQFSAIIRKIKPPEPYKGKGIRYLGEYVQKKVGKRVATTK